ncbi:MAG: 3'-5' exoribonuclease domain-containing protein [Culicoidibacterales bacterium]
MNDFIIDYETLGDKPNSVVLDVAVVPFVNDPTNVPKFMDLVKSSFYAKFDLKSQIKAGRLIQDGVKEFWKNQSDEARAVLKPSDIDVSVEEGHKEMLCFFTENEISYYKSQLWCRGTSFDIPLMVNCIDETFKLDQHSTRDLEPVSFGRYRDVRSAIEGMLLSRNMSTCPLPAGTLDGFIHHNSVHDCAKDVLMLLYAQRYAMGLEEMPDEETADKHSLNKWK